MKGRKAIWQLLACSLSCVALIVGQALKAKLFAVIHAHRLHNPANSTLAPLQIKQAAAANP